MWKRRKKRNILIKKNACPSSPALPCPPLPSPLPRNKQPLTTIAPFPTLFPVSRAWNDMHFIFFFFFHFSFSFLSLFARKKSSGTLCVREKHELDFDSNGFFYSSSHWERPSLWSFKQKLSVLLNQKQRSSFPPHSSTLSSCLSRFLLFQLLLLLLPPPSSFLLLPSPSFSFLPLPSPSSSSSPFLLLPPLPARSFVLVRSRRASSACLFA